MKSSPQNESEGQPADAGRIRRAARGERARPWRFAGLQEGWVIANHILVSFHVAFISSVLALSAASVSRGEVLEFIFVSPETLVSLILMYVSFHTGIAIHEIGHFTAATRLNALNESILEEVQKSLRQPGLQRILYLFRVFALAPFGRAKGIKREGLNYYPDAPYNLAVAAAGPRASRNLALAALPPAILLLAIGLLFSAPVAIYPGRLLLGMGVIGLLDFLMADPGKYREFREKERKARDAASTVEKTSAWEERVGQAKETMLAGRLQEAVHPRLGPVTAPWQFRNCGMGGRHTEKEYPESNISMQEAMFLILGASNYQDAQEITVRLQNRLKEIIEKEEGCRVMGIGLEGGLAPYIDRGGYPLPEIRLWAMMKQAIQECGYRPGADVALALDPAMSELEIAYREEFGVSDSVGMYLFWRDKTKLVLDRDGVLDVYRKAIRDYDIPILSIEDGFSEFDHEGWKLLMAELGDELLIIGDDLVTTNDRTIEEAAELSLINTVLIKANQIGTLEETLLAMLVGLGKGNELVVSHRSKSPNDDMEAHIALAANALGLKAGGGSNTERLVKYQTVATLMESIAEAEPQEDRAEDRKAMVRRVSAREEPTNAGIPTVGVEVEVALPDAGVSLSSRGATPLGTSAGTGEAVHLVDAFLEHSEHREVLSRHSGLFREIEPGVFAFKPDVTPARVASAGDEALASLYTRSQRYGGKGCLNAVDNVRQVIAPFFEGRNVAAHSLRAADRDLLQLELRTAQRRGKLEAGATPEEAIRVAQRKQNLGMNAILSVSLALARATAQVRGKELYELLREEMLAIIERLAAEHAAPIEGSSFEDYVRALRVVNRILESRGDTLYGELRRITGVYEVGDPTLAPRAPAAEPSPESAAVGPPEAAAPTATLTPAVPPAMASGEAQPGIPHPLTQPEQEQLLELDRALYAVYGPEARTDGRLDALRQYVQIKAGLTARLKHFEIVNHRLFRGADLLVVPYVAAETLVLHVVRPDGVETACVRKYPPGTIFTDELLTGLTGHSGEVVDVEREVAELNAEGLPEIRIDRIRDMASLLKTLNQSPNCEEVIYYLRFLVAKLCNLSSGVFLGAKNLQPEVRSLRTQLIQLLNGSFAGKLRLPLRILVRNISTLILRPSLIDELWNDTIDLAEIHVRGSAITNELRRSTHHALGKGTLVLARAYQDYLETGDAGALAAMGHDQLSPADKEARGLEAPCKMVRRIVEGLEKLLGSSQIVGRIREWQDGYTEELMRCEFGNSLQDELEALVAKGIRARNRWVYQHHLRILARKAEGASPPMDPEATFAARLKALQSPSPEEPGFDGAAAEREARECIVGLSANLRELHQTALFRSLESVLSIHEGGEPFLVFCRIHGLRDDVEATTQRGGFTEQRYLLHQLDCLLEEMGFLALRHIVTRFNEEGVNLSMCLEVIHKCAWNLEHSGLQSQELCDLAGMLISPERTYWELLNVLESIQRAYHKLLHRVSVAYEAMGRRLGLDAEELRAVLGNFQRYMHDLNSIAHFADLAITHIQIEIPDNSQRVGGELASSVDTSAWDILHISHVEEIDRRLRLRDAVPNLRERFGGKGSGLLYISHLGVPTRDGFVLPTDIPRADLHRSDRPRLEREVAEHLRVLEEDISRLEGVPRRLGDPRHPLLLAVRSGSAFSMPGMLTTVIFVGMNDQVAEALAKDDQWCAWDSYRRFLTSYSSAVWGLKLEDFDLVEQAKTKYGVRYKYDLPWEAMKEVTDDFKAILTEKGFGEQLERLLNDPITQLHDTIQAVFDSWDTKRATRYREIKGIRHSWKTAVVVQQMAMGNRRSERIGEGMDETLASLTGVVPRTITSNWGDRKLTGDYKFSAVGDDLVGGLTIAPSFESMEKLDALLPMLKRHLDHADERLRRFCGTDQELEFTVEHGVLSVLQSRMAETSVEQVGSSFDSPGEKDSRGVGIRGGGFRGLAAFDQADVDELLATDFGERDEIDGVLLILENPTPEEIPLILSADGLLTAKGGSSSHAAVAINAIDDKPYYAVFAAGGLRVNARTHEASLLGEAGEVTHRIRKGDVVSIHGQSGAVYLGWRKLQKAAIHQQAISVEDGAELSAAEQPAKG